MIKFGHNVIKFKYFVKISILKTNLRHHHSNFKNIENFKKLGHHGTIWQFFLCPNGTALFFDYRTCLMKFSNSYLLHPSGDLRFANRENLRSKYMIFYSNTKLGQKEKYPSNIFSFVSCVLENRSWFIDFYGTFRQLFLL